MQVYYKGSNGSTWTVPLDNWPGNLIKEEREHPETKLLEEVEWNDGYYLEGLDRCHTIIIMLDELLVNHPSVLKTKTSINLENIFDELHYVYNKISMLDFEESEKENT